MAKWSPVIWMLPLVAASGCTGSGAGLDSNGQPLGAGGSPAAPPPLTANLQSIQANIFTPICTRCHVGAGAPQGLQLDSVHSYALLVGVPSSEQSDVLRVKPGDPDHSYLILKLEGANGIVGAQMPFGGPYLPQSTIDVIRQWITDGAQPAAAAESVSTTAIARASRSPAAAPFTVIATSPAAGAVVAGGISRLVIGFNAEPDQSLVNSTTVELLRTGADASDVTIALGFARGNPSTLLLTAAVPLPPGTYRVRLRGTGGGALADVAGRALGRDESFAFTVRGVP